MKRLQPSLLVSLVMILFLASCCSKSKQCSILTFNQLELRNFSKDELSDMVELRVFAGGSNFSNLLGSYSYNAPWNLQDTTKVAISTVDLSITEDYELTIIKTGSRYRIRNFTVDKVACGKCVLRNNTQFGYELSGYSVNGTFRGYEGKVLVFK